MSKKSKKKLATSPDKFLKFDSLTSSYNDDASKIINKMLESMTKLHEKTLKDNTLTEPDLEFDLRSTQWICKKAKSSVTYSQNLYAALCNNYFQSTDLFLILKNANWTCSWRHAGSIIADMREEGDYMDWYCSGIKDTGDDNESINIYYETNKFVSEGTVTNEIKQDLKSIGWMVVKSNEVD